MGVDLLVQIAYRLVGYWHFLCGIISAFFLHQFRYTRELAVVANSINGAVVSYAQTNGEPQYWLFSLLSVALTAYGGGISAPIFIGRPSLPFGNDLVMITVVVAWYIVYYTRLRPYLGSLPVRCIWTVFLGLFRCYSVTNMVTLAFNTLPTSPYYPHPFVGPVLCGTIVGSMGMFMPFSKGLVPVSKSTPWNLQAAFMSAFFFHTMVNDMHGPIGKGMRMIFGTYSRETVIIIIGLVQVVHLELQLFLSPDVNLFTPIHKILYLLTQVNGPVTPSPSMTTTTGWSVPARRRMDRLFAVLKPLLVLAVLCGHCYYMVLPPRLVAYDTHVDTSSWTYSAMRYSSNLNAKWAHIREGYEHEPGKLYYNMEVNRFELDDMVEASMALGKGLGRCQYLNFPTHFSSTASPSLTTSSSSSSDNEDGSRATAKDTEADTVGVGGSILQALFKRSCTPFVAVLDAYPCSYDFSQTAPTVQRGPDGAEALRCATTPILPHATPTTNPDFSPAAANLAATASALKIIDWTKPTTNQPSRQVVVEPAPTIVNYTELAIVVYKDLVVSKWDMPAVLKTQHPVLLYPLLQTNHTAFLDKNIHLLVLDNGKLVMWTHDPMVNSTLNANKVVITYTYVSTDQLGQTARLVSQGESVQGLELDEVTGKLELVTDGIQELEDGDASVEPATTDRDTSASDVIVKEEL